MCMYVCLCQETVRLFRVFNVRLKMFLFNNLNVSFASDVSLPVTCLERWGAGVETQKNVRGEIGGWGRVPFNETYAPSLSTIYDGA